MIEAALTLTKTASFGLILDMTTLEVIIICIFLRHLMLLDEGCHGRQNNHGENYNATSGIVNQQR